MHRISRRMVAVLVVVGALAAGGAAYTNTITDASAPANTAGYAAVTVNGATLNDAKYTFSGDGTTITAVTFTFVGDESLKELKFGFSGSDGTPGVAPTLNDCSDGTNSGGIIPSVDYDGTTTHTTTITCTLGTAETTVNAVTLGVLVANA